MKMTKKSSVFKKNLPEINQLLKSGHSYLELIDYLKNEKELDLSLSTFKLYLHRYNSLSNQKDSFNNTLSNLDNNKLDNSKIDNRSSQDHHSIENQTSKIEKNDDLILDKETKSDIITTENDNAELSLTQKALNYSPSETRSKIDDKVKNLIRSHGNKAK